MPILDDKSINNLLKKKKRQVKIESLFNHIWDTILNPSSKFLFLKCSETSDKSIFLEKEGW